MFLVHQLHHFFNVHLFIFVIIIIVLILACIFWFSGRYSSLCFSCAAHQYYCLSGHLCKASSSTWLLSSQSTEIWRQSVYILLLRNEDSIRNNCSLLSASNFARFCPMFSEHGLDKDMGVYVVTGKMTINILGVNWGGWVWQLWISSEWGWWGGGIR